MSKMIGETIKTFKMEKLKNVANVQSVINTLYHV